MREGGGTKTGKIIRDIEKTDQSAMTFTIISDSGWLPDQNQSAGLRTPDADPRRREPHTRVPPRWRYVWDRNREDDLYLCS
jgi:hypothetical protein